MRRLLTVASVALVVAIIFVVLKLRETITHSRVRRVPDLFSLTPGKVTRDLKWRTITNNNLKTPLHSIVSCLQAHGAKVLRQEDNQAAFCFGSRIAIKISGNWPEDPLKAPLLILARTETAGDAAAIHVRLDEDFGGQLVLRLDESDFEANYNRSFDAISEILNNELGPPSE